MMGIDKSQKIGYSTYMDLEMLSGIPIYKGWEEEEYV